MPRTTGLDGCAACARARSNASGTVGVNAGVKMTRYRQFRFDPPLAGVSVEMSIRLSRAFGSTPETWLGMQTAYDLWHARERAKEIEVENFKATGLT